MTTEVSAQIGAAALEQVLVGGDLSRLSAADRVLYYRKTCESLGLNPLTKPFEYITLNGKMTLYAKRDCTEQLRKLNGVSIIIQSREVVEDCYVVTARATDKLGRHDESIGAVPIGALKGEARSNAMMKAETKAKRRVTLSICGMGMLDESEVGSIPSAYPSPDGAITPTAGALGSLAIDRQIIVQETAAGIRGLLANDQPLDAYGLYSASGFDIEEIAALNSLLDSKQRGVMRRMTEEERAHEAGKISDAQRKRLEARIKESGQVRDEVKAYCQREFGVEHFQDLSPRQYQVLDAQLDVNQPAAPQPSPSPAGPSAGPVAVAADPTDDELIANIRNFVKRKKWDEAADLTRSIRDEAKRLLTTEKIATYRKDTEAKT